MPVYEYRCHTCDTRFEARRPMAEASAPIACPDGHAATTRLLSVFAAVGRDSGGAAGDLTPSFAGGGMGGGGCCGGACGCGGH